MGWEKTHNTGVKTPKKKRPTKLVLKWLHLIRAIKKHILNPQTKFGIAFITAMATVVTTKSFDLLTNYQNSRRDLRRPAQTQKVDGKGYYTHRKQLQVYTILDTLTKLNVPIMDNTDILFCPECTNVVVVPKNQPVAINCTKCDAIYKSITDLAKENERE